MWKDVSRGLAQSLIITERGCKQNQPREKVHLAMDGDQAPASSVLSGGTNGDALTPPAKSCDDICKVLSTKDAHRRLGAQDFH